MSFCLDASEDCLESDFNFAMSNSTWASTCFSTDYASSEKPPPELFISCNIELDPNFAVIWSLEPNACVSAPEFEDDNLPDIILNLSIFDF